jgi:site-specific recombinase XerC
LPNQVSESHHFEELASVYLSHAALRLSADTLNRRKHHLHTHLLPFWGHTPLYDVTAMRIRKFTYFLEDKGLSPKQIQQLIVCLRVCLTYAVKQGWLNVLPWPKQKVLQDTVLTTDMPLLSTSEFQGLYTDLLGDRSGATGFR